MPPRVVILGGVVTKYIKSTTNKQFRTGVPSPKRPLWCRQSLAVFLQTNREAAEGAMIAHSRRCTAAVARTGTPFSRRPGKCARPALTFPHRGWPYPRRVFPRVTAEKGRFQIHKFTCEELILLKSS